MAHVSHAGNTITKESANLRRAATTSLGGDITEALPREVLRLTSTRARQELSRIPKNVPPARPYRSRRRYARSYSPIHQPGPCCLRRRPWST